MACGKMQVTCDKYHTCSFGAQNLQRNNESDRARLRVVIGAVHGAKTGLHGSLFAIVTCTMQNNDER